MASRLSLGGGCYRSGSRVYFGAESFDFGVLVVDQRWPSVLDSGDNQTAGGHAPLGSMEELKMPQTPSSGSRGVGAGGAAAPCLTAAGDGLLGVLLGSLKSYRFSPNLRKQSQEPRFSGIRPSQSSSQEEEPLLPACVPPPGPAALVSAPSLPQAEQLWASICEDEAVQYVSGSAAGARNRLFITKSFCTQRLEALLSLPFW